MENTNSHVLVHEDRRAIENEKNDIERSLPAMETVVNAYNELLPNVPQLTTLIFESFFVDLEAAIDGLKNHWYDTYFANGHQDFGITKSKGMALVNDQQPNFEGLRKAINETGATAPIEAFVIDDSKVIVNQSYVEKIDRRNKFYLTLPNELKVKETLEALITNLNSLRDLVPPSLLKFEDYEGSVIVTDFNQLHTIFDVTHSRFSASEYPKLNPKLSFYRNLKQALIEQGRQG